jgi:DNA mismatch repair protein MutS
MASSNKLTDDYLDYFLRYKAEYGDKICILMQIGSFYEMQMVKNDNEHIGNLEIVASLLNIQVTKKNKNNSANDRSNPFMAGFPKPALVKYIPILLENDYTVIVIDQDLNNPKIRTVTGVYSPSIQPLDIETCSEETSLTSIIVEHLDKNTINLGVANLNMTTNLFETFETFTTQTCLFDEIQRLLMRYQSKEIIIAGASDMPIHKFKEIISCPCHHIQGNNNKDINFQNKYLRTIYSHINFGLLQPIEYFDLSRNPLTVTNIINVLDFVSQHDIKYLENIAQPSVMNEHNYLILEMDTLYQLNVVGKQSAKGTLFDVINKTQTSIGRRALKALLTKPFKDSKSIEYRYNLSEALEPFFTLMNEMLSGIIDFERLHRRMSLGVLQPYQLASLINCYENVGKLIKFIQTNDNQIIQQILEQAHYGQCSDLDELLNELYSTFDEENLNKPLGEVNLFKHGKLPTLDTICCQIQDLEDKLTSTKNELETLGNIPSDWLKVTYSEQDGYTFTCTKARFQTLMKNLERPYIQVPDISVKHNTNVSRITTPTLQDISNKLMNTRELLQTKIQNIYKEKLNYYYTTYKDLFQSLKYIVEILDITFSNIKCKNMYKYCKPEIKENEYSTFQAKGIRHPVIERINQDTMYVPNDVDLNGMILYALNSCGKSSLLRSVGLCVIMAQCGLYVPCESFVFTPFFNIVSQVDFHDNILKAQSSFVAEMMGLKKILNVANERTLVLSDELTKGTEAISAASILAAAAIELANRNTKFIFTTHLQDVAKLDQVKKCKNIQICHLSVDISGNNIVFQRKLQDGPCSELYGLEVAKAVGLDKQLLDRSFKIRDFLIGKRKDIVSNRRSRYNTNKIMDKCEICNYTPVKSTDIPLDCHHINFQCNADNNDFNGHFHKNSKHNLVCLCKQCHQAVHNGGIIIEGYTSTTNGVMLSFHCNDD